MLLSTAILYRITALAVSLTGTVEDVTFISFPYGPDIHPEQISSCLLGLLFHVINP